MGGDTVAYMIAALLVSGWVSDGQTVTSSGQDVGDLECTSGSGFLCNFLEEPENGVLLPYDIYPGSKANFSCDKGFTLYGVPTLVCQNCTWSADPPTCELERQPSTVNISYGISIVRSQVQSLIRNSNDKMFLSKSAEAIVRYLVKLITERDLSLRHLLEILSILDDLVTLQEELACLTPQSGALDIYPDAILELSGILLDRKNQDTWLAANVSFGAPFFMELLERFGRVNAFSTQFQTKSFRDYSSTNIVMNLNVVRKASVRDISFPDSEDSFSGHYDDVDIDRKYGGSVILPASLFSTVLNRSGAESVLVSLLSLQNLQDYMPANSTEYIPGQTIGDQRNNSTSIPRGVLLSVSIVLPYEKVCYQRSYRSRLLPESVYINYVLEPGKIDSKATCAFWQFSNNSSPGMWSSAGVTTIVSPDGSDGSSFITCVTTHLTSFSVLVSAKEPSKSAALTYITYIGCGISLVCLLLTLVCLVWCRSSLQPERNFVNVNFVIALILALIFFLAGIDQSDGLVLCKALTVIMHYLFLSVFCWMLCEGILLYRFVVVVFDSGERYYRRCLALGWGVPAAIVAVSFGCRHDEYGSYDYCFLTHDKGLIYAFIGPMSIILLINLVVFVMVLKTVVSGKNKARISKSNHNAVRSGLRATAVLLPVLGLTWVVGVFAVDTLSRPLSYTFTILNTLQGVFVFLFHCVFNVQMRTALAEKKKLLHSNIPSLTSEPKLEKQVQPPGGGVLQYTSPTRTEKVAMSSSEDSRDQTVNDPQESSTPSEYKEHAV